MPKNILIVEGDTALSRSMRGALEARAFTVEETSDGKGTIEQIRSQRPDLVLLAVDLPAGQNGYILCGKLKKDEELKATPIIIVGNADGFAQHKRLKTRADEYLSKPVDMQELTERVGGLIGFPESAGEAEDESLSLAGLDDVPVEPAEEISVEERSDEATVMGDPELDMLDAAFDDISDKQVTARAEASPMPSRTDEPEEDLELGEEPVEGVQVEESLASEEEVETLETFETDEPESNETMLEIKAPPPLPRPPLALATAPNPPNELRNLRARVAELEGALDDAGSKVADSESRIQSLEDELSAKNGELEAAQASGGKNDKEFFALREAASRKDKEILKLKSEANEKDKEIVELRDREINLEQQVSGSSGEMARREAQNKSLTAKVDQLTAEKKRIEQQLSSSKEEARASAAKLAAIQSDIENAQQQLGAMSSELEDFRLRMPQLESELRNAQTEGLELRQQLEEARREAEDVRPSLERAEAELETVRNQLATDTAAHEEEANSLRKRVAELEDAANRNDERLTKLYQRIKSDEKMRDKTKKAISIALQLIEEQQTAAVDEASPDEPAAN